MYPTETIRQHSVYIYSLHPGRGEASIPLGLGFAVFEVEIGYVFTIISLVSVQGNLQIVRKFQNKVQQQQQPQPQ